jgi:hypothetical protein
MHQKAVQGKPTLPPMHIEMDGLKALVAVWNLLRF